MVQHHWGTHRAPDLDLIQTLVARGDYFLTYHAGRRMMQRGITEDDLRCCVATGSVVEEYPDDPRGHSCKIMGRSLGGKTFCCICAVVDRGAPRILGQAQWEVCIITVHWPGEGA